ncbi:hypothetical protein MTR_8g037145 [Medicago truncatula]|uniref:Uncharacterized protein n=1 Tax=Medicago truncatula TaxID=3880 RepID=A0A072TNI2_MEDTR|nr:hypothetical protein MTR_8g037145 [Medicago truncatula]
MKLKNSDNVRTMFFIFRQYISRGSIELDASLVGFVHTIRTSTAKSGFLERCWPYLWKIRSIFLGACELRLQNTDFVLTSDKLTHRLALTRYATIGKHKLNVHEH